MQKFRYIKTHAPSMPPHVLSLAVDGVAYGFSMLHTEQERYPHVVKGKVALDKEPHTHGVYHIVLYTEGESSFYLKDRYHQSRRGIVAVSSPWEPHKFSSHDGSAVGSLEMTFIYEAGEDGRRLELPFDAVLSRYLGTPIRPVDYPVQLEETATRALETLYSQVTEALTEVHPLHWYHAQRCMLRIFDFFVEYVYGTSNPLKDFGEDKLSVVREIIRARYTERLSLKELSDKACMSAGHFCRRFKKQFGVSPIEYQRHLRVSAAKVLLASKSARITQVAYHTGFPDVASFSKAFKKVSGVSPRRFRQQNPQ